MLLNDVFTNILFVSFYQVLVFNTSSMCPFNQTCIRSDSDAILLLCSKSCSRIKKNISIYYFIDILCKLLYSELVPQVQTKCLDYDTIFSDYINKKLQSFELRWF